MNRPLLVGLTGGIGSGKSVVAKIFSSLGVPIYDADSRAKKLMNTDPILITEIKKEFGERAYREDRMLNREYLAATVFNNEEKLKRLNQLVHPRVQLDTDNWVKENLDKNYLVKEAALLFETGANRLLDKVIVVTAPEELRTQRVLARDAARSPQEVASIMRNQMKEEDKVQLADFIINNDESELVLPQVLKLHERFNVHINN